MEKDYQNYKIWKEVPSSEKYLLPCDGYSLEEITEVFSTLLDEAVANGLEGCYLQFESTKEPYEDYLWPPVVKAMGYRKLSAYEIEEQKEQDEIENLAKKLGISLYGAATVRYLEKSGKVCFRDLEK